jgi:hypothetical protein
LSASHWSPQVVTCNAVAAGEVQSTC